jgi:hypothetical protein
MGIAFPQTFVGRNYISTAFGKKLAVEISFLHTKICGNAPING